MDSQEVLQQDIKRLVFEKHKFKIERMFNLDISATAEDFDRCLAALSPYEKGVLYKKALDHGCWPSWRQLGEDLCVFDKHVSENLKLLLVREPILSAFKNKSSIQQRWVKKLISYAYNGPVILSKAKQIQELRAAGQKWPAARVYKELTTTGTLTTDF